MLLTYSVLYVEIHIISVQKQIDYLGVSFLTSVMKTGSALKECYYLSQVLVCSILTHYVRL